MPAARTTRVKFMEPLYHFCAAGEVHNSAPVHRAPEHCCILCRMSVINPDLAFEKWPDWTTCLEKDGIQALCGLNEQTGLTLSRGRWGHFSNRNGADGAQHPVAIAAAPPAVRTSRHSQPCCFALFLRYHARPRRSRRQVVRPRSPKNRLSPPPMCSLCFGIPRNNCVFSSRPHAVIRPMQQRGSMRARPESLSQNTGPRQKRWRRPGAKSTLRGRRQTLSELRERPHRFQPCARKGTFRKTMVHGSRFSVTARLPPGAAKKGR